MEQQYGYKSLQQQQYGIDVGGTDIMSASTTTNSRPTSSGSSLDMGLFASDTDKQSFTDSLNIGGGSKGAEGFSYDSIFGGGKQESTSLLSQGNIGLAIGGVQALTGAADAYMKWNALKESKAQSERKWNAYNQQGAINAQQLNAKLERSQNSRHALNSDKFSKANEEWRSKNFVKFQSV